MNITSRGVCLVDSDARGVCSLGGCSLGCSSALAGSCHLCQIWHPTSPLILTSRGVALADPLVAGFSACQNVRSVVFDTCQITTDLARGGLGRSVRGGGGGLVSGCLFSGTVALSLSMSVRFSILFRSGFSTLLYKCYYDEYLRRHKTSTQKCRQLFTSEVWDSSVVSEAGSSVLAASVFSSVVSSFPLVSSLISSFPSSAFLGDLAAAGLALALAGGAPRSFRIFSDFS